MSLQDLATPPVRLRLRGAINQTAEKLALRTALAAAHLFGIAWGMLLRQLRAMNDPLATALARAKEAEFKATSITRAADILGARFDKLPERRRPFYTPRQRFQILELKNLLGWPADHIARLFRVCNHTILNWERHADPTAQCVGQTLHQAPPITRMADVVRNTLLMMKGFGFGGDEMTARVLARAGRKLSARTVGRIRRNRSKPPTRPPTNDRHKTTNPVVARFVNHTWMMDVTLVQTFLNGQYHELYLAGVFDAFSRVPLVLQTFDTKPGASAMARLLKTAARAFGKAKYLITDQGKEFSGGVFRKTAARRGIVHRFGTVGRIFATARLERFWRTLKHTANVKYDQPLNAADLERRLETALTYYLCFRPHQGLQGATPAEAFLGVEPACTKATSPPRGRTGEGRQQPPFEIGFLDPDRRALPILKAA
jgi:transposase InsO family protein